MPPIHSGGLSKDVTRVPTFVAYLGLFLFLLSFFLPAVGDLGGFESAIWAIGSWPWNHDSKISSLAAFGGWLNLEVLLLFCLFVSGRGHRTRSLLVVTILFSIPMTWIAIYRMNQTSIGVYPLRVGHFLWIGGILLMVVPELSSLRFTPARWLAVGAGMIVAVMSVPIVIGLTMRAPSEMDDLHYDQAWNAQDPGECSKIDPNSVGRPDQRDSWDFTYMQSDCYRNVAAMLHNPQLCDRVRSGSLDRLIGSIVAKAACRKQRYTIGTAFPGTQSSPEPFRR